MAILFAHHPDTIARLTLPQMRTYHRWIESENALAAGAAEDDA